MTETKSATVKGDVLCNERDANFDASAASGPVSNYTIAQGPFTCI